jgi:membrane protein
MLALVPFLGFLITMALGVKSEVADEFLILAHQFLPAEAQDVVADQIAKFQEAPASSLLSLSLAILLWSASSLFVAVIDANNAAYEVKDYRPWWWRRLMGILLTIVESILLVSASLSIILWPNVSHWIGLTGSEGLMAEIVQWVVVTFALTACFSIAYYFSPGVRREWKWFTPGATFGVILLISASLGFRFYLRFGTSYSVTYGVLAGIILLLLWFYIAALALLLGAEINSVIALKGRGSRAPTEAPAVQAL